MAKEIAIDLRIDTSKTEADLVLVEDSLKDIEDSLKKIGAGGTGGLDEELDKLNKLTTQSKLNWGEMGKAIEQYQNIALAAGKESPIGQEAIRRASELKQEMDLVTQSVDGLSKKGANLQAALQVGTGVVAGYGAFQGVLALTGTESENLQKTFVKLQAAQTVLVSIEQLRMSLQKESVLMTKLQLVWTKAETFATNLLGKAKLGDAAATTTATVATRAFTAALIATGIGAIVVALGLLIANFDKVRGVVMDMPKHLQNMSQKFKEAQGWVKVLIGIMTFGLVPAISMYMDLLEKWGVVDDEETAKRKANLKKQREEVAKATKAKIDAINKEIEANKKLTKEVSDAIDFEIEKKQAAGEDYAMLEKEKITMLIRSAQQEIALINQKIEAKQKEFELYSEGQKKWLSVVTDGYEKEKAEQQQLLKEQTQALELWNIKQEKLQKDAIKKSSAEKKKAQEKELADEKKHQEDLLNAKLKAIEDEEAVTDAYRERQLTDQQKELDDLQNRLYKELEMAGENNELKLLLEEEFKANEQAINDKYRLLEEEKKAEADKKAEEDRKKQLEDEKALQDAKLNLINNTLSLSAKFAELFAGKSEKAARVAFNVKKAADISSATLDGYRAVLSTYAQTPGGPVLKGIAAGIAGGFAAAQIAAIAKTPFGGGGSGSVSSAMGSITSGSVSQGNINTNSDQTTNIEQLLNGNSQNQPVLVTDSFTKVKAKQDKIETLATL